MDYMFAKVIWYVLFAFVMGAAVGWFLCSSNESNEE